MARPRRHRHHRACSPSAWCGGVGSTYARFADFVPGPAHLWAHLRGHWAAWGTTRSAPVGACPARGHALSGRHRAVSNDEIAFSGPLRALVSSETSDWLSGLHRQNYWAIIVLVGLHVSVRVLRAGQEGQPAAADDHRHEGSRQPDAQPAQGGGAVAFIVALAITAAVLYFATGSFIERLRRRRLRRGDADGSRRGDACPAGSGAACRRPAVASQAARLEPQTAKPPRGWLPAGALHPAPSLHPVLVVTGLAVAPVAPKAFCTAALSPVAATLARLAAALLKSVASLPTFGIS